MQAFGYRYRGLGLLKAWDLTILDMSETEPFVGKMNNRGAQLKRSMLRQIQDQKTWVHSNYAETTPSLVRWWFIKAMLLLKE